MDVFGRVDQILRGGLSSDSLFMSWPELSNFGLGLLIQRVGIQYRQPVRRVFEIGPGVLPGGINAGACDWALVGSVCANRTQPTYYIIGRPEGRLQLGRFVGPEALTCDFYRRYGSPCSGNVVQISGKAGCSPVDASARVVKYKMNGVLLDDLGFDVSGQEMVMQEGVGAMFAGLNLEVVGDPTCGTITTSVLTSQ